MIASVRSSSAMVYSVALQDKVDRDGDPGAAEAGCAGDRRRVLQPRQDRRGLGSARTHRARHPRDLYAGLCAAQSGARRQHAQAARRRTPSGRACAEGADAGRLRRAEVCVRVGERTMTGAGWLTRLQRMLVILGVACLGYYGYATVGTASFQRRAIEEFRLPHELRPSGVSPASQTAAARPPTLERASAVQGDPDWARASFDWARASFQQIPFKTRGHDALAVLHIPRLGMVTPVVSGRRPGGPRRGGGPPPGYTPPMGDGEQCGCCPS